MLSHAPHALKDLGALLGREESMHTVHGAVLRAARALQPVVEAGAVLAVCSDEFNGELRAAFDLDVARQLPAPDIPAARRVFAVSNMGVRVEPGGIALANLHFTARSKSEGEKLLLVEIAGHVGRRETPEGTRFGELDRFGPSSPCCGALRLLLDAPKSAAAVRFPWFDQLTAFFGPERLRALRGDDSPHAMVRAAIVHAVLQAESAIVDLLREPPTTPTHVLLVSLVVVNRRGPDNAILVGLHHLHFDGGETELLEGTALRSTPGELVVDDSRALIRVSSSFPEGPVREPVVPAGQTLAHAHGPLSAEARGDVEHARRQYASLHAHPRGLLIYARAALRAFLQRLSIAAPEAALAALALEGRREVFRPFALEEVVREGRSSSQARRLLHDIEPNLQQLGHLEAREVLEILLSERHPVLGS